MSADQYGADGREGALLAAWRGRKGLVDEDCACVEEESVD